MSIFNTVSLRKPKSSVFNLSHDNILTLAPGNIVPIWLEEVVPGDRFRFGVEHAMRCMPMRAPFMGNVRLDTFFFYVPTRLIWRDFDSFLSGEKELTVPQIDFLTPLRNSIENGSLAPGELQFWFKNLLGVGSLADYFGVPVLDINREWAKIQKPTNVPKGFNVSVNALPFKAYALIWNEYFRVQYLQDEININLIGDLNEWNEVRDLSGLRKCRLPFDYFTSALPFLQKGDELSINALAPKVRKVKNEGRLVDYKGRKIDNGTVMTAENGTLHANVVGQAGTTRVFYDPEDSLALDYGPGSNGKLSVSDLRRAFSIQRFLEKQARTGSRFKEVILANFGVNVQDFRLDRPEFLGGYKSPLITSEVLQTSETTSGNPLGTLAGRGVSVGGMGRTHFFPEHGYIIGVTAIRQQNLYTGGLPKMLSRKSRFDFYWPDFQHIGEEAIRSKELYFNPAGGNSNNEVFGYQSRYADYKFHKSAVHGDLLTNLSYWHTGRIFSKAPELNSSFLTSPLTKRIMSYQGDDFHNFILRFHFDVKARRPMSYFSNPI